MGRRDHCRDGDATRFVIGAFVTVVFNSGAAFAIGMAVVAVVHYGVGLTALAFLFVPTGRLACPWTHGLGCWNAILSAVCVLLYTLQRPLIVI